MASSNPAPTDTITSSTPAGAAEQMMPVTIVHLVLIAVCIALTVAMIWWGNRLWKGIRAGREELDERGSTVEVGGDVPAAPAAEEDTQLAHVTQPTLDTPVPVEPVPAEPVRPAPVLPVAPAPPPLADDPLPGTPAVAPADDLTTLKGLGPRAAVLLAEHGVTSIAALAALSPAEAAALDARLGAFTGRMTRDRWHEQAQLLTAGDRAGYEATFGKLG